MERKHIFKVYTFIPLQLAISYQNCILKLILQNFKDSKNSNSFFGKICFF